MRTAWFNFTAWKALAKWPMEYNRETLVITITAVDEHQANDLPQGLDGVKTIKPIRLVPLSKGATA
ncbi:MAG: hypothetical protein P4L74_07295 [Candidatus Doudnabacteria bacterium]|nr:hypothetical protein [Candidatus Doudnabacteria bacterium]